MFKARTRQDRICLFIRGVKVKKCGVWESSRGCLREYVSVIVCFVARSELNVLGPGFISHGV